MPAFDTVTAEFLINPGQAVSPIVGNTEHGSAAYDPATGQAFYAVYHDSAFRLFRTVGGYRQLILVDDSVEEVGVIVAGPWAKARNIGLTWIDGTLYALIIGSNIDTGQMCSWIYTVNTTTGAGTVVAPMYTPAALSDTTDGNRSQTEAPDVRYGGEIIVFDNGAWGCTASYFAIKNFGGILMPEHKALLMTSSDEGLSWSAAINIKGGSIGVGEGPGTPYTAAGGLANGSNSYGELDGYYHAGFVVNAGDEFQWRSNDGVWTLVGEGNSATGSHKWPFSVGDTLYEERGELLRYTTVDPVLNAYTSTGVDLNDYGLSNDQNAAPHFCNIHTTSKPYLIATKLGKVVGIGSIRSGWVIGRVGPTW
jgi:hypothetical protein